MMKHIRITNWREQIEAIIAGDKSDVVPAVFRIDKWFHSCQASGDVPAELAGLDLDQTYDMLGLPAPARQAKVFDVKLRSPVICETVRTGDKIITKWHTPKGDLRLVCKFSPGDEAAGLSPTIIEYPIKCWRDYEIYNEILLHTEYVRNYEAYRQYDAKIGLRGLPLVILGPTPFHELLVRWVGYEKGYMDLFDRPDVVMSVLETANKVFRRMWPIVADSPARFVMHGVNFETAIISPNIFREYFLDYCKHFNEVMHQAGKYVAFHADGDMSGLLELVVEAKYDVADCFACSPMVKCTIEQARKCWRDKITIWGGVGSNQLDKSFPLDELQQHLENVYQVVSPGDRFILGVADQVMPGASWDNIKMMLSTAQKYQNYPIEIK